MHKVFNIRTCSKKFPDSFNKERPCLNYHMKQCNGICLGNISEEEYQKSVDEAIKFLDGNYKPVEKMLEEKMRSASENLEFERAAEYRDLLESVRSCVEKQKITHMDTEDQDIVAIASEEEDAVVQVFFVRNGKLIGRDHFFLNVRADDKESDVLAAFLKQFYAGTPFIPKELYLQTDIGDMDLLADWLSEKRGSKVKIFIPQRGSKKKLVDLAAKNASLVLSQDRERIKREEGRTIGALKEIAGWLNMESVDRLEAYDISNTSGYQSVGSMVVFEKGKQLRSDYRKFRLKTVEGPNDYASMKEVLARRFQHGLDELKELEGNSEGKPKSSFIKFPDVIMMDGGRGQVNIALEVLEELHLDIPVCGMVKDEHHNTRGLYYNNVEIPIDKHSEGFKLITRLQDEAHRFAIEYHKSLRGQNMVHSFLDDIEGIGPARRKALMKAYESVDALKAASVEELSKVNSMNVQAAESVYNFLHKE